MSPSNMLTDWRALCEELFIDYEQHLYRSVLADRVRTALAQPEPEVVVPPSDEDLLDIAAQTIEPYDKICLGEYEAENNCAIEVYGSELIAFARTILARWGNYPAKPDSSIDGPAVPEGREPASVVGEPSDQELLELMPETMRDEFSYAAKACSNATGGQVKPGIFRVCLNTAALEYARAVLARYGHQPAPPAEGEVADEARYLARELRDQALDLSPSLELFGLVCRAADLLERQAAPVLEPALARINDILNDSGRILQTDELEALELARRALEQRHPAPVPVSERLPEARDCLGRPTEASDAGWCWTYSDASERWSFQAVVFPRSHPNPPLVTLKPSVTHWLPHYALPLPSMEVKK